MTHTSSLSHAGMSPQWATATSHIEVEAAQRPAVCNGAPTLCDSGGEAVHLRRSHIQYYCDDDRTETI